MNPLADCERLKARGRWREAEKLLAGLERGSPRDSTLAALRHQALFVLGRLEESFVEGERFLDLAPTEFDLNVFWSQQALTAVDRAGQLRRLERLPRTPWAHFYRGILRPFPKGLPDLARIDDFPSARYAWMHAMIGRLWLFQGRPDRAVRHLKKAGGARPLDWKSQALLAETLLCAGKTSEALRQMDLARECTATEGGRLQAQAWKGELCLWLGRYREALRLLDGTYPAAPFSLTWRAAALLKLGRGREALAGLQDAAKALPEDPELPIWRGETLRELGRYDEALEELSRKPISLWARFNRGLIRAEMNDEAGMMAEFGEIPAHVRAYVARRAGDQPRRILTAGLALAKGYRREDPYSDLIWMV